MRRYSKTLIFFKRNKIKDRFFFLSSDKKMVKNRSFSLSEKKTNHLGPTQLVTNKSMAKSNDKQKRCEVKLKR